MAVEPVGGQSHVDAAGRHGPRPRGRGGEGRGAGIPVGGGGIGGGVRGGGGDDGDGAGQAEPSGDDGAGGGSADGHDRSSWGRETRLPCRAASMPGGDPVVAAGYADGPWWPRAGQWRRTPGWGVLLGRRGGRAVCRRDRPYTSRGADPFPAFRTRQPGRGVGAATGRPGEPRAVGGSGRDPRGDPPRRR